MKTLAVVVLNWNGLADTRALLPTLERCRVPEGWRVRVLVVDNGSSDGSAAAIAREFPAVEVVALPENRRFAGGCNAGLERALAGGADAVMLLNNDTEAEPGLLEHLLLALEQDPAAGAAAPLICLRRPLDRIWYAGGRCVPALGLAAHRGLRQRDRGPVPRGRADRLPDRLLPARHRARRGSGSGRSTSATSSTPRTPTGALRARAAGFRLLFVPTARLWHKVSASSGAASPWKIYQRLRANLTLFARHARGVGRLTWLPCFLAQQAALAAWLLLRGHARRGRRGAARAVGCDARAVPPRR